LEAAHRTAELLGRREVAEHWREVSVLAEFSVAGLAGHLLRGMKTVELYLDRPEPEGEPISAADYFRALALPTDVDAPLNRDVRSRGEEMAAGGPTAVATEAERLTERLAARLAAEGTGRRLRVAGDLVVGLDEYLRTRVVELVVHGDDLAVSVGLEATVPSPAATMAIDTLVGVARLRHGDVAVVRALARRERDAIQALRVL
jgi:Mycothiol maleylpyruvate isomerase N-terminal domain